MRDEEGEVAVVPAAPTRAARAETRRHFHGAAMPLAGPEARPAPRTRAAVRDVLATYGPAPMVERLRALQRRNEEFWQRRTEDGR